MRPNLFRHATGELTQDAILGWLLEWAGAGAGEHDPALHAKGKALLSHLYAIANLGSVPSTVDVKVRHQVDYADLIVEIDNGPVLLIEDKTFTQEHSNQLRTYRDKILQRYPNRTIAAFYVKIGEQGNYDTIEEARYHRVSRRDLLQALGGATAGTSNNAILSDYVEYLSTLDQQFHSFSTMAPSEWTDVNDGWHAWHGFFVALQGELSQADWSYVPNKAGGFMGFWWHVHLAGDREVYLQLENNKLCFKITVPDSTSRSAERNEWHRHLMACRDATQLPIVKPSRFGTGEYMTTAVLQGDYRSATASGMLDFNATIQRLHEAESFLDHAVGQFLGWPKGE